MTNNITLESISNLLKAHSRFIIISHVRPDGDTLACAFALKNYLESIGKTALCSANDRVSDRLSFICTDKLYLPDEIPENFCPDLIVTVDVASKSMLGNCDKLLSLAESIKIDHHSGEDCFADHNYTDPTSASCSEIIYDIIESSQCMSDKICELLYAGISFDTGCFKHSNVTESTHKKAAYLVSRGVNTSEINRKLFANKSQKEICALKMAYNSLEYYLEGKIAVVCITNKMKEEFGLDDDDLADISQLPAEISGVLLGITIKEKSESPNHFKVSMRSVPGTNAGNICRKLGGGGHVCAAGGLIIAPLGSRDAVKKAVDAAISEMNT